MTFSIFDNEMNCEVEKDFDTELEAIQFCEDWDIVDFTIVETSNKDN